MRKKIEAMYDRFGVDHEHKCGECPNFKGGINTYFKCRIYGESNAQSTDWAKSWVACGMFGKEWDGDVPVIRTLSAEHEEEQIAGQLNLFDYL